MSDHDFTTPEFRHVRRQYAVRGGTPLSGTVRVSGLGRSALAVLSAATICPGSVTVRNLPDTEDVALFLAVLSRLGHDISYPDSGDRHTVLVRPSGDADPIRASTGSGAVIRRARNAHCLLGAFLGRYGRAVWSDMPYGSALGIHPLMEHLKGFEKLGARWETTGEGLEIRAEGGLRGGTVRLEQPSVGVTVNLLQAAALAEGRTVLENAPDDPAVRDLAAFLNAMGADIRGAGTNTIEIRGVPFSRLHDADFSIVSDAEEAGVYLCMAAATGGDVTVEGVCPEQLYPLTDVLSGMGAALTAVSGSPVLRLTAQLPLRPFAAESSPLSVIRIPLLTNLAACAAMADGLSVVTDFRGGAFLDYAGKELAKMGADVSLSGRNGESMAVRGTGKLQGAPLSAFARVMVSGLLTAGLAAAGETTVDYPYRYLTPYDHLEDKIRSLGGDLEMREIEEPPIRER